MFEIAIFLLLFSRVEYGWRKGIFMLVLYKQKQLSGQ